MSNAASMTFTKCVASMMANAAADVYIFSTYSWLPDNWAPFVIMLLEIRH